MNDSYDGEVVINEPEDPPGVPAAEYLSALPHELQVRAIVEWFRFNFEDPANSTPHDSSEGGYQYIWGGPYNARDQVDAEFGSLVSEKAIDEAVEEIERYGFEWAPNERRQEFVPTPVKEPEDGPGNDFPLQFPVRFGTGHRAQSRVQAIRRTVAAHSEDILALSLSMSALARTEITRLRSQKPNEPEDLEHHEAQVAMLESLANGFEAVAVALEGATNGQVPEERVEKASGILDELAQEFRAFWDRRKQDMVELCVTIPAMSGGVALLNFAGADPLVGTVAVTALVGGKKVVDVLKEYKGSE